MAQMTPIDFSKLMMGLDLTKGADEFIKRLAQYPVPGLDMHALLASQRDNLEALAKANRAVFEGMQAVAEWQAKILRETMQGILNTTGELSKVGSPQDKVAKHANVAQQAFQTAVTDMRELAEIVTKAQQEASRAITERVTESLGEIKDMLRIEPKPPESSPSG